MNEVNLDQQRSTLVKEINYLFRNPQLSTEQRNRVIEELKKIVDSLKN